MVSAINSALAGINSATKRIEKASVNIANSGNVPSTGNTSGGDNSGSNLKAVPDLASNLTDLNVASYDFKASLKVLKVQQEIDQSLLDIKS